jgi:hypothetical protein
MKNLLLAANAAAMFLGVASPTPSHAEIHYTSCISFTGRTDDGDTGYQVKNNCGRDLTVVVYSDGGGMDYLNLHANHNFNWTTGKFNSYKACEGFSNTTC